MEKILDGAISWITGKVLEFNLEGFIEAKKLNSEIGIQVRKWAAALPDNLRIDPRSILGIQKRDFDYFVKRKELAVAFRERIAPSAALWQSALEEHFDDVKKSDDETIILDPFFRVELEVVKPHLEELARALSAECQRHIGFVGPSLARGTCEIQTTVNEILKHVSLDTSKIASTLARNLSEQARALHRSGKREESLAKLREITDESQIYRVLSDSDKQKILLLQASLTITREPEQLTNALLILEDAKKYGRSPSVARVESLITYFTSGVEPAISILEHYSESFEVRNQHASYLIEKGEMEQARKILNYKADDEPVVVEQLRLLAILDLMQGDLDAGQQKCTEALSLSPDQLSLRLLNTQFLYFSSIELPSPRECFTPQGVPWNYVKQDVLTVKRLRKAFAALVEIERSVDAAVKQDFALTRWKLACLANDRERQDTAAQLCMQLLDESPLDEIALSWVCVRNFPDVDLELLLVNLEEHLQGSKEYTARCAMFVHLALGLNKANRAKSILDDLVDKSDSDNEFLLARISVYLACGELQNAEMLIDKILDTGDCLLAKALLAKKRGRFDAFLDCSTKLFQIRGNRRLLEEAIIEAAYQGQWQFVLEHQRKISNLEVRPKLLEAVAVALYNTGDYSECISTLQSTMTTPTPFLKRVGVLCHTHLGHYELAISDIEWVVREQPTPENILLMIRVAFQMHSSTLVTRGGRLLLEHRFETATKSLIEASQLVSVYTKHVARGLLEYLLNSDRMIDDDDLLKVITVANQLNIEEGLQAIRSRLVHLAQKPQSRLRLMSFDEVQGLLGDIREHQGEVLRRYSHGQLPVHTVADAINTPLVEIMCRNGTPVFSRHGSRVEYKMDLGARSQLNFGVSLLLLLETLGVLSHFHSMSLSSDVRLYISNEAVALLAVYRTEKKHRDSFDSSSIATMIRDGEIQVLTQDNVSLEVLANNNGLQIYSYELLGQPHTEFLIRPSEVHSLLEKDADAFIRHKFYLSSEDCDVVFNKEYMERDAEACDNVVTRVSDFVRDAIDEGTLKIIPSSAATNSSAEQPTLAVLQSLIENAFQEDDVVCVCDRFVTRYRSQGAVPIVALSEILYSMFTSGSLNQASYVKALQEVRLRKWVFEPFSSEEVEVIIDPKTDASVLAAYSSYFALVALTLFESGPSNEGLFIVNSCQFAMQCIFRLWASESNDSEFLYSRTIFIIRHLVGTCYGFAMIRSTEAALVEPIWIARLIFIAVGLDSKSQTYIIMIWNSLLRHRLRSSPSMLDRVGDLLARHIAELVESGDDESRVSRILVLRRFFDLLPQELVQVLTCRDGIQRSLRLNVYKSITINDLRFSRDEFWSAYRKQGIVRDIQSGEHYRVSRLRDGVRVFKGEREEIYTSKLLSTSYSQRIGFVRKQFCGLDLLTATLRSEIERIVAGQDVRLRVEKYHEFEMASQSFRYSSIRESFGMSGELEYRDFSPICAKSMRRRWGIDEEQTEVCFFSMVDFLLRELDFVEVFSRLATFPCPIPLSLVETYLNFPEEKRRCVVRKLSTRHRTPLSQLHLLYLLNSAPSGGDKVLARYARLLQRRVLSEMYLSQTRAFLDLVKVVYRKLSAERRTDEYGPVQRILFSWAHAEEIFRIVGDHASPQEMEKVSRRVENLSYNLDVTVDPLARETAYPPSMTTTRFVAEGFLYANQRSDVSDEVRTYYLGLIYEDIEVEITLRTELLFSPFGENSTGSFFSEETRAQASSIIGKSIFWKREDVIDELRTAFTQVARGEVLSPLISVSVLRASWVPTEISSEVEEAFDSATLVKIGPARDGLVDGVNRLLTLSSLLAINPEYRSEQRLERIRRFLLCLCQRMRIFSLRGEDSATRDKYALVLIQSACNIELGDGLTAERVTALGQLLKNAATSFPALAPDLLKYLHAMIATFTPDCFAAIYKSVLDIQLLQPSTRCS